jgi:hypothetical protein
MLTVDAFLHAAQMRPTARDYWLSRLAVSDDDFVWKTLQRVPDRRISMSHRKFAYENMMFNRGRLLAARPGMGND